MDSEKSCQTVVISNPQGFHARPAYLFAEMASKYDCRVEIVKDGERVDGTSILEIITLGAAQGTELSIETVGPDSANALVALARLVGEGFRDNELTQPENSAE